MKKLLCVATAMALTLVTATQAQTIEERLSTLESKVDSLENRVSRLETFHPELRQFSVKYGSFTFEEFNQGIETLNLKDGDWLYAKASGDMRKNGTINTMELCTQDSRIISLFTKYLDPDLDPMQSNFFNVDSDNNETFVKDDLLPTHTTWMTAAGLVGDVWKYERIRIEAQSNAEFLLSVFSRSGIVHFYSSDPTNTVTFVAGSSRQQACGF